MWRIHLKGVAYTSSGGGVYIQWGWRIRPMDLYVQRAMVTLHGELQKRYFLLSAGKTGNTSSDNTNKSKEMTSKRVKQIYYPPQENISVYLLR